MLLDLSSIYINKILEKILDMSANMNRSPEFLRQP